MYQRKANPSILWKILAVVILLFVVVSSLSFSRQDIRSLAYNLGYNAYEDQKFNIAPSVKNLVDGIINRHELPTLQLDIKQKYINVLQEKAELALKSGKIQRTEGDKINATLTVNGEARRVKLRLKGDQLDHLRTKKVSLRVEAKAPVFGVRNFNLQHPKIRGFLGPFLLDKVRKKLGIIAPRHYLVRLVANGRDYGLMHMEEHFSKELLESNRKKDTLIMKFDEDFYWNYGKIFDYKNSPLTYFSRSKKEKDPYTKRLYEDLIARYELFLLGELPAHELFDCESWGHKVAVDQYFGTVHGLRWSNLRFYANPYSLRLEPIGFDDAFNERLRAGVSIFDHDLPFISMLYQDPKMLNCLNSSISKQNSIISRSFENNEMLIVKEIEKNLQKEFYFLNEYNTSDLYERISRITDQIELEPKVEYRERLNDEIAKSVSSDAIDIDLKLLMKVLVKRDQRKLIIPNAKVIGIKDVDVFRETVKQDTRVSEFNHDMVVELGTIPLEALDTLHVKLSYRGETHVIFLNDVRTITLPVDIAKPLSPMFLHIDHQRKIVSMKEGEYVLDNVVELPRGYSLTQDEGKNTVILARGKAGLVVNGGVDLRGSLQLNGTVDGAGWMLINAEGSPVNVNSISFTNTTNPSDRVYPLTGSFTIYDSAELTIKAISFENVFCEDALNIVDSDFTVLSGSFSHTYSDAIDVDFGKGVFTQLNMYDVGYAGGGDAVDVSGSRVIVSNSKFEKVSDKAISAGENSELILKSSKVVDALVGVAAKDGSKVVADNNEFRDSGLRDFMAYTKKPEYPYPRIDISSQDKRVLSILSSLGSTVYYNGDPIASEEIDVDQLYNTVMKSSRK